MKTENCVGNYPLDFTLTSCDTISCLSLAGHMTGKPPDIDLPPPPVPPPQESPSPRKKGKIYQMLAKFRSLNRNHRSVHLHLVALCNLYS